MPLIVETIKDGVYIARTPGMTVRLIKVPQGWDVCAENAVTRAWRSLGYRYFSSIEAVENHYQRFQGLAALINLAIQGQSNLLPN